MVWELPYGQEAIFVTINEFNSQLLSILTGVPQGSILGPLFFLFLIYINDLPSSTNLFSLLFADDTASPTTYTNSSNLLTLNLENTLPTLEPTNSHFILKKENIF
jgi:hypothetical protein